MRFSFFIFLTLVGLCPLRGSLPQLTPASQRYRAERWENEIGLPQKLPQNHVVAVSQTNDGYLWVAMFGGVAKFNGQRFIPFGNLNPSQLLRCLYTTKDGTLWVGTAGEGALKLQKDGFSRGEFNSALVSQDVRSLVETQDGALWVGTANQLVRWKDGKILALFPTKEYRKVRGAYALIPDGPSGVLAGTSRGLVRVQGAEVTKVLMPDPMNSASITALARTIDGTLWAGSGGLGIARISPQGETSILDVTTGLPSNHVRSLLVDHDGRLWAGTMQGLVVWDGKRFVQPEVPDMDLDYDIISLSEDGEHSLWVSGVRGLVRLDAGRFALLNTSIGVGHRSLRCVTEFSDGAIWVGASNGGVTRIKDGKNESFRLKEGIERITDTILNIEEIEPGVAAIATYGGIFFVRDGKPEAPPQILRYSREVRVVHKDPHGALWLGTAEDGAIRIKGEEIKTFTRGKAGTPENDIRSIIDDGSGGLWIGSANGLVSWHDDKEKVLGVADGLPSSLIHTLYRDPAGALWIGTDKGLARLANGKFSSWKKESGLFSEDIREIVEDREGCLWMTSPAGLFRMRKGDLESSASGNKRLLGNMRFGSSWGVASCVSQTPSSSTACRLRDGRLVFATVAGLLVIEPAVVEPNLRRPPITIDEVRFDSKIVPIGDKGATVGPGQGTLELDFSALCYQDPARVVFRYRMEGVDPDWIPTDTRRTVSYHNLKHGTYTFQVIACNNDGLWNEEGRTLLITVLPQYYETNTFRISAVLLLIVGAFGAYRWRIRQIKRRQEELALAVEERTRSLKEEIAFREKAEKELRSSEERFSKFFGSSPIPLALISLPDGRFTDANPSFCNFVNESLATVLSGTDQDVSLWPSPEMRSEVYAEIQGHQRVFNRECETQVGGKKRRILLSAEHLSLKSGVHMLLIVLDITDRIVLEQQVRQLQKIEATGQLAAGIAHDFNNLLTVIIGQLSLLMDTSDKRSAEDQESLVQAQKAAERAATLTRQLLMFSRKQRIDQKPFQLNDMIRRLMQILTPVMGESIDLNPRLAPDLPLLSGDETMLEQVMVNIAMNARDAMPNGGRFSLSTDLKVITEDDLKTNSEARLGTFIRVVAKDTGSGMSPEILERVFEPFFTTKEPGRGTGLGMPMAYGTVKQHGGWIDIKSVIDQGTEISIFLPVKDTKVAAPAVSPIKKEKRASGGCILYVEDEAGVRKMVQKTLERHGYKVIAVSDARTAIEVWRNSANSIDLVFSDIVMPGGISGVDLVEMLRDERPGLRVLLATGYSSDAFRLKPGAGIPIMAKPFSMDGLLQTIEDLMNQ